MSWLNRKWLDVLIGLIFWLVIIAAIAHPWSSTPQCIGHDMAYMAPADCR